MLIISPLTTQRMISTVLDLNKARFRRLHALARATKLAVGLGLLIMAMAEISTAVGTTPLNSRYNDEQPSMSGDGRYVAFVANREGSRELVLYDLQQQQFVELPRLNRRDAIAENPSISNSARYIVYVASDRARPDIELYDRITGQVQVLTAGYRGWVRNPSISANGRYITFETGQQGQWDIQVIDRGPRIELDLLDNQQ
jgi:Tol biopolymer transport system component